jgi:PadR family transcriptional regulator PadR
MPVIARLSALWKNLVKRSETERALELMVLQTLDTLGPLHGYSIAARLEQFSGAAFTDFGALYPGIRRLEQRGLVRARWDVTDTNRKARFYAITAAGRRQRPDTGGVSAARRRPR